MDHVNLLCLLLRGIIRINLRCFTDFIWCLVSRHMEYQIQIISNVVFNLHLIHQSWLISLDHCHTTSPHPHMPSSAFRPPMTIGDTGTWTHDRSLWQDLRLNTLSYCKQLKNWSDSCSFNPSRTMQSMWECWRITLHTHALQAPATAMLIHMMSLESRQWSIKFILFLMVF